jgi:hypothetical protein
VTQQNLRKTSQWKSTSRSFMRASVEDRHMSGNAHCERNGSLAQACLVPSGKAITWGEPYRSRGLAVAYNGGTKTIVQPKDVITKSESST